MITENLYRMNKNMQKVAEAIKNIIWMARRYADGRRTFAAKDFNDAYDVLRDFFGDEIDNLDNIDSTLTENGKYFPYAQDGDFDCITGRKYILNKS